MGFTKKTWKNRIAEYINRRLITMEDGNTNLVTVARDEGTISQEGDAFNAANMNDLEDRIEAGFADVSQSLTNVRTYVGEDGKLHFVDSAGADSVLPFKKYEDGYNAGQSAGYNAGYTAGQSELQPGAPVAIAFANNYNCDDTNMKDIWLTWNSNYFYKSGAYLAAKKTCQLRYVKVGYGGAIVGINNTAQTAAIGNPCTINAGEGMWVKPESNLGGWSQCIAFWIV